MTIENPIRDFAANLCDTKGYSINVRKSKIGTNDDREPFTIIEYTLSDEVRDKIGAAISQHTQGKKIRFTSDYDACELSSIASQTVPQDILYALHFFTRDPKRRSVCVLHNLPENPVIDRNRIASDGHRYTDNLGGLYAVSYMTPIMIGLAQAAGLNFQDEFSIFRRQNQPIAGSGYHSHRQPVYALSAVLSDNAPTGFRDNKTNLEQEVTLSDRSMMFWSHDRNIDHSAMASRTPIDTPITRCVVGGTFGRGEFSNITPRIR